MSIASEITRIQGNISDAYTAASAKGATLPATQNSANLASTISTISGGGVDTRGWIPRAIDANGKLVGSSTMPNFAGVKDLDRNILQNAFIYDNAMQGALRFPDLTSINGEYAMENAFKGCTVLTSVDLSSLTSVNGSYAMKYAFSSCWGLTSVDLSSLSSVGSYAMYNAFDNCRGLTSVDLSSLSSVGSSGLYETFSNCFVLKKVVFSSLISITGSEALYRCFNNCSELRYLVFPSLTQVNNTDAFDSMLSGVVGCTVVFPAALESVIGNWSSVTSGFGGTNTRVIFGETKDIQVSIPQGYTVYFNDENITNNTEVLAVIGNNEVKGIDNTGRAFKYTFVVDSTTTTFTPDVSGLTFNEFQLTSNESGVVFEAAVDVGSLTVDANNKVYATAGFSLTANGTKEGFTGLSTTVSTDSSATVNVQMFADSDVVVLDSSNIVSLASGDTGYLSVDTTNNLIKYGNSTSYISAASVQITLTPPAGTTNVRIITGAYTSTERGYDYGYISLGTQRVTPSNSNVRQGVIANGSYLFRDSGVNTAFTPVDSGTLDQTNLVLSIGIAEDSSIRGDNMLYIQPIKVYFW